MTVNKDKIKKMLSPFMKIKHHLKVDGWVYIGKQTRIVNPKRVFLSDKDQIAAYCLICPHGNAKITMGENVTIGMFSRVACINEIIIGKNTLTGPNVFISDYNHEYRDINTPICFQGNTTKESRVIIGEDSWIGTNVVICGNVTIGKHVVIGAGSLVNKDIPDYCVAVGNPARVIKKYNFDTNEWERC